MRPIVYSMLCLSSAACQDGGDSTADCGPGLAFAKQLEVRRFFRGNTHTHTQRSFDSKSSIAEVVEWYRDADYAFVVLTDHDVSSVPGEFAAFADTRELLVLDGEEVSSFGIAPDGAARLVHVNAVCANGITVGGAALHGIDVALKDAVDRVIDIAGAVPQVNHPNIEYAIRTADILYADRAKLLEIANQYPLINNAGDKDHASTEEMWDELLTMGMEIYGVASDDTHELGPASRTPPGKGWIQVAADELSANAICEAIGAGAFYASTGVELARLGVSGARLDLTIAAEPEAGASYTTVFSGDAGSVLETDSGLTPTYELSGSEMYVRATVYGPNGATAWAQPYFVRTTDSCGVGP